MNSDELARLYESIRNAPEGTNLEWSGSEPGDSGEVLWQVRYAVAAGNFMTLEITKQVVAQEDVETIVNAIRDTMGDWPAEEEQPPEEGEEPPPEEEEQPEEEQPEEENWEETEETPEEEGESEEEEQPEEGEEGEEGEEEPDEDEFDEDEEETEEINRVQEMLRMYGAKT